MSVSMVTGSSKKEAKSEPEAKPGKAKEKPADKKPASEPREEEEPPPPPATKKTAKGSAAKAKVRVQNYFSCEVRVSMVLIVIRYQCCLRVSVATSFETHEIC